MNSLDLYMVIYDLCDNNDIEDADELDELHRNIVDTVTNALIDYADDHDIEDFDASL